MLNRKCTICTTSKPFWAIRSAYKPVFHRYLSIGCDYSTHKCLEREIWRFSCHRRQRQDIPCACARGNYVYVIHAFLLCTLSGSYMPFVHRHKHQCIIIRPRLLIPTVGVDNRHRMAIATNSLSIKATNKLLPPTRPPQASPAHKEELEDLACSYVCMATLRNLLIIPLPWSISPFT